MSALDLLDCQLQCMVCLEEFHTPKMLTCQHTFCLRCIKSLPKRNNSIRCPSCRADCQIPDNDLDKFPTSFLYNSLLDIRNQLVKETCNIMENEEGPPLPPNAQEELMTVVKKLSEFDKPLTILDEQMREIEEEGKKVREEIQFQAELAVSVVKQSERKLLDQVQHVVQQKVDLLQAQKTEAKTAIELLKQTKKSLTDNIENSSPISTKTLQLSRGIEPASFYPIEKPDIKFNGELQQQIGQLKYSMYDRPVLKKAHLYVNKESVTTLFVKSHDGKPFSLPSSLVTSQLVNVEQNMVVPCNIREIHPGKFAISCKPKSMGKHHMIVRLGGIQITENTFTVPVTTAPEDRGTFVKESPLHAPYGVAIKRNGDVIVCEYGAHNLRVLNKNTVSNVSIKVLPNPENIKLHCPSGIALSTDGHMFVTDQHRLLKLTSAGKLVNSVGGSVCGNKQLEFRHPHGVAIHPTSGQIYVADTDNRRIQVLNQDLTFSHMFGSEERALGSPSGLAFDSDLNLYIADCGLHRIIKVTGDTVVHIGFYGVDPGQLNGPRSLAIDSNNVMYVAEEGNHRISVFDTKGTFKHCFGRKGCGDLEFNQPMNITVDSEGYLYVCDFYNNRLVVLS